MFNTHAVENSNKALLFSSLENLLHLRNDVLQVFILRNIDIRLDFALLGKQLESLIVDVQQSELVSFCDRSINHVSRVEGTFILFASQDVLALADDLSRTVLTWLGSGNFGNLAWVALHHDERAVLESLGLDLLGLGSAGIGLLEFFVSHFDEN